LNTANKEVDNDKQLPIAISVTWVACMPFVILSATKEGLISITEQNRTESF